MLPLIPIILAVSCGTVPQVVAANGSWAANYTTYPNATPSDNLISTFVCNTPSLNIMFFVVVYISILLLVSVGDRSLFRFAIGTMIGMFFSFLLVGYQILPSSVTLVTIAVWAITSLAAAWWS